MGTGKASFCNRQPAGASATQTRKNFIQKQSLAVILFNIVTHYLAEIAEGVKYCND